MGMEMEITLTRPGAAVPDGTVIWDPETGDLSGPLADEVRALAGAARRVCCIVSHPMPSTYEITDPLRDRRQMAAVLSQWWRVPEALAGERGATEEVEQGDVPVIY